MRAHLADCIVGSAAPGCRGREPRERLLLTALMLADAAVVWGC